MFESPLYEGPVFGEKLSGIGYGEKIGVYGIVVDNKGKIAIIKNSTGYFLPGGGLEKGESHAECLKREFIEETGYEIEIESYIGTASLYHTTKTGEYKKGTGHFYRVNLKADTGNKIEEDHELLWFEPNKAAECLFLEHQSWAVLKVLKQEN